MRLDILYPLIVPASYVSGGAWNLPHHPFPNREYILTWVFFLEEGSMTYITADNYIDLNRNYEGWQQKAFENLRKSVGGAEVFYTDFLPADDGGSPAFIMFSNEDGIGSGRILLTHELEQGFPHGYKVAMPDRALGIVISNNISENNAEVARGVIDKFYGCTGTAMSMEVMPPDDFRLPSEWLEPINSDLSEWIVEKIRAVNK